MSDDRKEAEEKMEKAIFISGDGWLAVFDLLPPSQLGLGIALISHRFDFYVDEHFKTRKWALGNIAIRSGTKKMEIVKSYYHGKPMPIPQMKLPSKVIGFKYIWISFIDQNVVAFLHRFRRLFDSCPINLAINTYDDRMLEFALRNIWPVLGKNIYGMELSVHIFHSLRKFVPSLLNNFPLLRVVNCNYNRFFAEFPPDDSANASAEQAVAKWLFTAHPNNVPKVLRCSLDKDDGKWSWKIGVFKEAFANASSPSNFIVVIWFPSYFDQSSVEPFDLTNELTREQLALKRTEYSCRFLLVRCPIARDVNKWAEWEEEAIGWQIDDQWNKINIGIGSTNEIDTVSRRKSRRK